MGSYVVLNGDTPSKIASKFGVDFTTMVRMNPRKPWHWVAGVPTFLALQVGENLTVPNAFALGQLPSVPSLPSLPDVTSDLAQDAAGQAAAGQNLIRNVTTVADVAKGVVSIDPAQATQALAQVQSSITSLLANGVTVDGVTPGAIASAFNALGGVLVSRGGALGTAGEILLSTGEGAAGGAVGGPIGAAIGGAIGFGEALVSTLTNASNLPGPGTAAKLILGRLQQWTSKFSTIEDPIGWRLYDWVSWNIPYTGPVIDAVGLFKTNQAICTPWLWGKPITDCNTYVAATAPPGSSDPKMVLVQNDEPPGLLLQGILARLPKPSDYAAGSAFNSLGSNGKMQFSSFSFNNTKSTPLPNYPYLYQLGTVFSMLAGGASDQAIAAELLSQNYIIQMYGDPNEVSGMAYSPDLASEFLSRLPSKAQIQAQMTGSSTTSAPASTATVVAGGTAAVAGLATVVIAAHAMVTGVGLASSAKTIAAGLKNWVEKVL